MQALLRDVSAHTENENSSQPANGEGRRAGSGRYPLDWNSPNFTTPEYLRLARPAKEQDNLWLKAAKLLQMRNAVKN